MHAVPISRSRMHAWRSREFGVGQECTMQHANMHAARRSHSIRARRRLCHYQVVRSRVRWAIKASMHRANGSCSPWPVLRQEKGFGSESLWEEKGGRVAVSARPRLWHVRRSRARRRTVVESTADLSELHRSPVINLAHRR
jgi:hypothetical protein